MIKLTAQIAAMAFTAIYLTGCTQVATTPGPATLPAPMEVADSPKLFYLESQVFFHRNRIPEAVAALENAIQSDPESSFLKRDLIHLKLKQNDKEGALETAEALAAQHPENVDNLLLLVRLKKETGQEDATAGLLRQILELDSQNKETYLRLGKIYMENQQFDKSLALFRRMVANMPDYYVAHFYLGEAHLLSKDDDAALKSYRKTVELEPNLLEPRFRMIEIFQRQGKNHHQKILDAYEKILEIEPGNDRAELEMALFHYKTGNKKKAAALFFAEKKEDRAKSRRIMVAADTFLTGKRNDDAVVVFSNLLKTDPDNENLHFFLGMAYESQKKPGKAIDHFLKVTPAHPQYKKTILTIAFLYRDMDKPALAVSFLEKQHRQQPDDLDVISYLSSFYEEENRLTDAMDMLEKGLALDKENTALMFRLGAVQDKAGLRQECIATMTEVIRLNPDDASALNYLGYTYADMGVKLDQARDLIARALKLKPDDGYITDSMGWVYYRKKEYEKAVVYLEKAAKLTEFETIIAGHLADAYAKMGRLEDALAVYKTAVKNAKDSDAKLVDILAAKIKAIETQLELDSSPASDTPSQ